MTPRHDDGPPLARLFAIAGEDRLELVCCLPVGGEARLDDGTTFIPPWAE